MQGLRKILLLVFAFSSSGCAFVNLDMMKPLQPLEERRLEGEGHQKILLLDISGIISEKDEPAGQLNREKPSTVALIKESLQKAENDNDIAGIVLRINSPGGTVTASDIIHHEIMNYKNRTKIPVYAVITGLGTSGGYYVATAADRIIALPTAVTGSIGVIMLRFNLTGLLGKIGVAEESTKSGDKKDILSPFRNATPEEQKIVQGVIDSLFGRFIDVILARKGNELSREALLKVADGRIVTSRQALDAKLIDNISYLDDNLTDMKKQLNLNRASIVTYYRPGSYKGTIYSSLVGDTAASSLLGMGGSALEMLAGSQFLYLWHQ